MDEMKNESVLNETTGVGDSRTQERVQPSRQRPQRRRKSKQEIFKEKYLPRIIMGIAGVLILFFIIGSITRSV